MFEETLFQKGSDGKLFAEVLKSKGILPGIKVCNKRVYQYFLSKSYWWPTFQTQADMATSELSTADVQFGHKMSLFMALMIRWPNMSCTMCVTHSSTCGLVLVQCYMT